MVSATFFNNYLTVLPEYSRLYCLPSIHHFGVNQYALQQVTIKDIAKKLNISASTVSRALRGIPEVNPETRKAVQDLARILNYEPNAIALSLVRKRTKTIGIVIPEIADHFFSSFLKGVEAVANHVGYHLLVCQSDESYSREVKQVKGLVSSRVDGLMISFSSETKNYGHIHNLVERSIPIVLFDRVCENLPVSSIRVDDYEGAVSAVEHLIQNNRRRIAYIGGPEHMLTFQCRFQGYLDALSRNNLPIHDEYIVFGGFKPEHGMEAAEKLFNRTANRLSQPPDGVFAISDSVALGAMRYLQTAGYVIPDNVAVVGFSNESFSPMINPALTTVAQPAYKMGELSMRMLLEQILVDPQVFQPQNKVLKTHLIVRESTKMIGEKLQCAN